MLNQTQIICELQKLKPLLQEKFSVEKIGIFGSFAKNSFSQNSDIDIFFEGSPMSIVETLCFKNFIEQHFNMSVDVVRLRQNMNPILKKEIIKYGIYI